jgi:hypothetical protein
MHTCTVGVDWPVVESDYIVDHKGYLIGEHRTPKVEQARHLMTPYSLFYLSIQPTSPHLLQDA